MVFVYNLNNFAPIKMFRNRFSHIIVYLKAAVRAFFSLILLLALSVYLPAQQKLSTKASNHRAFIQQMNNKNHLPQSTPFSDQEIFQSSPEDIDEDHIDNSFFLESIYPLFLSTIISTKVENLRICRQAKNGCGIPLFVLHHSWKNFL